MPRCDDPGGLGKIFILCYNDPMSNKDVVELLKHWSNMAEYDMKTAQDMFNAKRYPYALFMCHLSTEKLLKAVIVKQTNKHAPHIHNLVELGKNSGINFSEEQQILLADLKEFNLEARYPEWKKDFYKKANRKYTEKYLLQTKSLFIWLKKYLKK